MDYTYIDYFNYYLKEYLSELVNTFPETRDPILANYRSLLEGNNDKNDIYAKCYYTKINNFLTQISKKDETLFETPGKIFIEGVDLYSIWNNTNATNDNRIAIWKYLQILMILGRRIIPNHKEIVEILNKVSNGNINVPAKVEKTLTSDAKDDADETPSVFGLGDIASSLGGISSLMNGLSKGDNKMGGIMNGLTSLMGGGGSGDGENQFGGIGNLMSGLTGMLSNPEFTNAMNNLSQQMTPNTDDACNDDACNDDACNDDACNDDACNDGTCNNDNGTCNNDNGTCNTDGLCTTESREQKSSEKQKQSQKQSQKQPQMFNNQLFGDLAEEIGKTFNFEEMEKDGKPKNIGEALSKFMSGNNPAKLMELVGKFGGKLQDEVKKGNINPAKLLKQTMSAAGGSQNIQNMMQNPQMQQHMKSMQSNSPTKDRLRAKLDKKNAEKQSD